jgi:hypothetical protein
MDTDWILGEQRLSNINHLCFPEKLPYITLEFIYVNLASEVVKTTTKKITLTSAILSKELLISIIHHHKEKNVVNHYTLKDTLMFHIPLEPEILPAFLEETFNCSTFMKPYPIIEDIHLSPSIFIFHPVNTLFFVYHEQEKVAVKLKSALKNNDRSNRVTKRVFIKLPTTSDRNTRRRASSF